MKNFVVLFFVGLSISVFAQREVTLYGLDNVYQASFVNPVAEPTSKVSVSLLPSIYFGTALPISGRNVIKDDEISPSNMIDGLNKGLWNMTFTDVNLLGIRFKAKKWFWNASIRARNNQKFMVDKDLLELAWYGNGDLLGDDVDLSSMATQATAYTEIGFGGARDFGDKWRFGAKVKLNLGIANASNTSTDAVLYFDPTTYEASLNGGYRINTASLPNIDDEGGFDGLDPVDYLKPNFKNMGLGIDLGAQYKFNDKLSFSASLVDVGFINWKDNPQNYNLEVDGVLKGADAIGAVLRGEDTDSVFNSWIEEIADSGDYSTTNEGYTTMTHGQFYFSAKYKLTQSSNVYGRVNMFLWQGLRSSLTAGVSQEFGRFFQLTVNNTIQYNRLFNIGLGLVFKPGPVQIYMVADNVLVSSFVQYDNFDFPIPTYATNVNFRFGINLVFGKIQTEDKIY